MRVAAIQMVSTADVQANLAQASELLEQAALAGAELAVLPEYFCLMGQHDTDKLAIQEAYGRGPLQDFLSEAAQRWQLWLVGGTVPLSAGAAQASRPEPERVCNSTLVFDPQGLCVARYDKIHLFRFDNGQERYDESRVLEAGQHPCLFDLTDRVGVTWRVGLSVCYDLRFPELFRHHAAQGADVLLVPSAFTYTTGQAHWEVLLRARAIENLSYVVAAAQGGHHPSGRRTWGRSLVVDPWGNLLAQHAQGPGVVLADMQQTDLQAIRAQLPALQHRVPFLG